MAKKNKKQQSCGQQFLSPEQYLRQKARTLEIGTCYVTTDIDEAKLGHVIVTRRHTGGRISMAAYLVDMDCLGVKDSFYQLRMEDYELDEFLEGHHLMFRECSYEEAHNRVWGSIAFAQEAGIEPDKSFQLTQYMLEEDTDDVPMIEYEYGRNGQHFLFCQTGLEASRYLPLLKKNLGEGNYKYAIGTTPPYPDDKEEVVDENLTTIHDLPVAHLDMADIVNVKPVTGPKYISGVMGLEFHNIEDEAELRRKYVDYILKHPEDLLNRLPESDIDTLFYIFVNPNMAKCVPSANTRMEMFLEIACVADTYWNDYDEYCVRVADDFQKVALPLVADLHMSAEARERYEVEIIINGMANLYGEVTLEDAKRGVMIAKSCFRSEAGHLIDKVMDQSLSLLFALAQIDDTKTGLHAMADDNYAFCSRFCWEHPSNLRKAIGKQPPMPTQPFTDNDAHRFSIDEIKAAGSGEVPTIPNKRHQVFWDFLTRELDWDDYYARRTCFELWYKVNHIDEPDYDDEETIEDYFKEEMLSTDGVTDEMRNKGLRLLADYVAHIPRWTLKGHSPADWT